MARKLKGFNIKRLFVDHGEKLAFGVVLLLVVLGLVGTDWVPYDKQPSEFTTRVESARENIEVTTWPDEEREKFKLHEATMPRRIVDAGINDRIAVTPLYLQSQPQWKDKDARDAPLEEPELKPVVEMQVSDARVLIRQAPKFDDTLLASAGGGIPDDDGASPGFSGRAGEFDDNRPDEFRGGRTGGGLGGFGDGDERSPFGSMFGGGSRGNRDYTSMDAPELQRRRGAAGASMAGGRSGSARGGRGSRTPDVDVATGRRGRDRGSRRNSRAEEGDEVAPFGGGYGVGETGMYGGAEVDGKAYPFVSVRGVFEFREQIRLYSEAIHKNFAEALRHFMIVDFKLERQRLVEAPDVWTDWELVNDQVFRDILKEADGFDPEVVDPAVTDAAITCPLPARLTGEYRKQATHDKLEKYTLSPQEMDKEIEYQQLLLEKVIEQKKQIPEGLIVKKGFADMMFDARSVNQAYFGSASAYGGGGRVADDDDRGGFGMSPPGSMGMGGRPGSVGMMMGGQPANPMLSKTIDQLALELAERTESADSKEAKEELKKWIEARVNPQGDLLLFRYFDFDVEPGQTYRYRVSLDLQNPNYNAPLAATGGVASVRDGTTRQTPWSAPTSPIRVSETVSYFLTNVQPPRSLIHPQARMKIFQYDLDVGTVVHQELDVAMGQNVGGKTRTEQADPAKGTVDDVDYTFKSNDVLLDVIPDVRFSRNEHPDLQLPTDSRGLAQIAEIAAVITPHGQIKTVDPISQSEELQRAKQYKEWQDEQFSNLRDPDEDVAGGGYGYIEDEDDVSAMGSMSERGGKGGGRNNPLRRGSGRGGRGGGGSQ